ncbi:NAD(P)/FAD-dependent oxidoreductase [Porticoccus sp.]|uniref:NAD(P)/FAD-dependent oxidoreductase n=1 Tax=Porticoccus sp. TaxID=2024853 RepID=UPI000C6825AF|nr:NAD(P)/FAD-dependent oxidoreductase [Porticoccus sp.]MAZ71171.1 aminoacetone oxidase family FAD-binding enzyme [Porticoccus sp.]
MNQWDVIVIGAGAAGLMAALFAGQRGRRVLLLERANRAGKKILMSGGGRCNFTNLYVEPEHFLSANPHFCKSALSCYSQWDFIELVNRHGIPYHEKTLGQLFCDNSSRDILDMLLAEAEQVGVVLKTGSDIREVTSDDRFRVVTTQGELQADSLVVACGGLSVPTLGGSDFGYRLARQFGHRVVPLRPALVPFTFTDGFKLLSEKLSGLSVPVRVSTGGQSFLENMLFTHRGLSGPAVLQISSYWREEQMVQVDLLPNIDARQWLLELKTEQPRALLRTLLSQSLPRKLVRELEELWWREQADRPLAEWSDHLLASVAGNLQGWSLKPAGTEGYRTAEVTLGGVDTREISSKTMESQRQPGLFFVGEVLDVTGHLGGFNFQWAWASGAAAGRVV